MRFPVNFLLYLSSLGLLGHAGYQFYLASSKLGAKPPETFSKLGQDEAQQLLKNGRGKGANSASWSYGSRPWWEKFGDANFTGKLPPPPPLKPGEGETPPPPVVVQTPLEDIVELVELCYDADGKGTAGRTHIIVRYKTEAQVEVPEAERRRREVANGGGGPPDTVVGSVVPSRTEAAGRGGRRGPGPATPVPAASSNADWLQQLSPGESLWGQYSHIKLLRVQDDAQAAWFVRELPAVATAEGQDPPPKPKEEPLYKQVVGVSQQVLEALANVGARVAPQEAKQATGGDGGASKWIDSPETTRTGDTWNIGRNDVDQFQRNNDELLAGVGLDNYVSKWNSDVRGVRIVNVDPQIQSKFGIAPGEVLMAVNGEPVKTKSDAMNVGKKQYDRGTRTFVLKFLNTSGQFIERTYQAPDQKK